MAGGHRQIVCPACGAINRVPQERDARAARCGACKAKLFDGTPHAVDAAGFERHVSKDDVPILVDVWAPWCGPCRAMAPMFERAAAALEPEVRLLKVNSDEEPALAQKLGVRGIPALFLLKGGRVVAQTAGAMDTGRLVAWTRQHLDGIG